MTVAELLSQKSVGQKTAPPAKERRERVSRSVVAVPVGSSVRLPSDSFSTVQEWGYANSVRGNRVELVLTGKDGRPSLRWVNRGNIRPSGDRDGTLRLMRW